MPDTIAWPSLPSGWSYEEPKPPSSKESATMVQKETGSVLRDIMGPQKPEPPGPSFLSGVIGPTLKQGAKQIAETIVPTDPVSIGLFIASNVLLPGSPLMKPIMGKVGGMIAPIAEEAGASMLRRVAGMGAVGGLLGGGSGLMQGLTTQLGGEMVSKLTRFTRANAQVKALAEQDPEALGKVVIPILDTLKPMRSPKDFHAAFKLGQAQTAASQAYGTQMGEVSKAIGETPIMSVGMRELRGQAAAAGPTISPAMRGMGAYEALGEGGGAYSFDDVAETIRRLRTQGYLESEAKTGLIAKLARDRAKEIERELSQSIPQEQFAQFQKVNESYARKQRIIDFMNDPELFKGNGDVNIPQLQKKFKSAGYNTRESYQMAADADALGNVLFRSADTMAEDTAHEPGSWGLRLHLGFLPTIYPHPPKLGSVAGREPYGLTPYGGSQLTQLLGRGISAQGDNRPITLAAPDEK